jgi:hypothetical protein
LFWQGDEMGDFELHFSFRLSGGNSGVHYRSRQLENFAPGGYQFDIAPNIVGNLIDTGIDRARRDLFRSQRSATGGWHEGTIVASGSRLVHKFDGEVLCDINDTVESASRSGWIGLEIGGNTTVEFTNIRLKQPSRVETPSPAPKAAAPESKGPATNSNWITLFDGTSLNAWQGWKGAGRIGAWEVLNGELRSLRGGAVDLATREQFGDFELELEWKVTPGANSGILYRALPSAEQVWRTAPEYQVVDDATRDGRTPITAAGSIYGVVAPRNKQLKRVGEFNSTRIIARGSHVEHWLNGTKILDADLASSAVQRTAQQKFNKPAWGQAPRGHILLQNLGGEASYRNIRIRKLD